jgi:hypothetical protein
LVREQRAEQLRLGSGGGMSASAVWNSIGGSGSPIVPSCLAAAEARASREMSDEVTAAQLYSSACAARSACVRRLLQQPLAALTAQQLAQQLAHDGALEVDAEALHSRRRRPW